MVRVVDDEHRGRFYRDDAIHGWWFLGHMLSGGPRERFCLGGGGRCVLARSGCSLGNCEPQVVTGPLRNELQHDVLLKFRVVIGNALVKACLQRVKLGLCLKNNRLKLARKDVSLARSAGNGNPAEFRDVIIEKTKDESFGTLSLTTTATMSARGTGAPGRALS
ncbi:hypothetical protein BD779DRAFT_224393 [Infundibulicybe gibba]|nr:hypothetical protein BD779DRAFT_224393 [Infundibulicybe gibba]